MFMQVEQLEHKKQWKIKYKCSESVYLIYMETSLKKCFVKNLKFNYSFMYKMTWAI